MHLQMRRKDAEAQDDALTASGSAQPDFINAPPPLGAEPADMGVPQLDHDFSQVAVPEGDAAAAQPSLAAQQLAAANLPVATLTLNADTETANRSELTMQELQDAQVGHSWVTLQYHDAAAVPADIGEPTATLLGSGETAFGFWPLIMRAEAFSDEEQERLDQGQTPGAGASDNPAHQGFSLNPFKSVPGRVEEPDTAHQPKIGKSYDLTQAQVTSLMTYVNSKRSADYNLYTFNCTTFAVECVEQAGQAAPSGSIMGIALPNALYSDLYEMSKKGDSSVSVAPLGPDERHEDAPKKN